MTKQIASRRFSASFIVGLFVILGTIFLAIVVVWLGAGKFLKENKLYVTYFDGSIGGLETGSPVKYQGLPVGTVSKVSVARDGRLIEVILAIDQSMKITDSMRATAEFSGIAGGKFIQLFYPTSKEMARKYPNLSFTPGYPLIKSSPSGFEEIEIAAKEVINNLRQLQFGKISQNMVDFLDQTTKFMISANKLVSDSKIQESLGNLLSASEHIRNIASRADSSYFIANLENSAESILRTSKSLEKFSDMLNKQVDGLDLPKKALAIQSKFDSLMNNTQFMMNTLTLRTENILFNFNELVSSMKLTNKQVSKSLREISDNPAQVFLSEPPAKEK
jgi:ABC-type transporter Mla subunit MlaD